MNFDKLKSIDELDKIIDINVARLKKKISQYKESIKSAKYIAKLRKIQDFKIKFLSQAIGNYSDTIIESFPSLDNIDEYYFQLINLELNFEKLKKSLGAINWIKIQTRNISQSLIKKIKMSDDRLVINHTYREFLGRLSSIAKQTKVEMQYLETSRKVMKKFPSVRTKLFTICISGFPNVGKSTLLANLTSSVPDIQNYAFTTKKVNAGYVNSIYGKAQIIDTPGTLAKDKLNKIERQAHLALKYLSNMILFCFDLTETSYKLEDQYRLLTESKEYDKEIYVYLTKQDIIEKKVIDEFLKDYKDKKIKYKIINNFDELKKVIEKEIKKNI